MSQSSSAINYSTLEELEGLTDANDNDFITELVKKYLSLLPDRLGTLHRFCLNADYRQVMKEIHSFKLSCQIIGADQLTATLERMAQDAQQENNSSLNENCQRALAEAERVKIELEKLLTNRSTQTSKAS
jgi:HPt (histidine-containing phosphotransfer) domain-containing protein